MKHIRIVCTAKKISADELAFAKEYFTKKGFKISYGKHLHHAWKQFAGTDTQRAEDLEEALNDPYVDVIWFARGGYGSLRAWQKLQDKALSKQKILVGYSDMTVWLCQSFLQNTPAIHATMPISFAESTSESLDMVSDYLLTHKKPNWQWKNGHDEQDFTCKARLFGGNLSLLYSLSGTSFLEIKEPIILLVEDLEEYYYATDRMLLNLSMQPFWSHVVAIVLGGFTQMHDNQIPFGISVIDMVKQHSPNIPVLSQAPFGHQSKNLPFLIGEKAKLTLSNGEATLNYADK